MTIEETTTETPKKTRASRKDRAAHVDPEKRAEWEGAAAEAAVVVEAAKQEEAMPPRRFESPLPCKLTPAELNEKGKALEAALAAVDVITAERKTANDGFKARTEIAMEVVRDLRKVVRTECEERNVEQIERFDLNRCTAETIRTDTGEIVSTRALRSSELQPSLPLDLGPEDVTNPDDLLRAAQGESDPADSPLDNDGSSSDLGDDDGDL